MEIGGGNISNNIKTETEQKKEPAFVKAGEQYLAQLEADAKAFDIEEFTQNYDEVITKFVAGIGNDSKGRTIHFKRLNVGDAKYLDRYPKDSNYDRGLRALALMMFKADGKTTFEKLKRMEAVDAAAILQATTDDKKKRLALNLSKTGSPKT
jgi:hypothetical protein